VGLPYNIVPVDIATGDQFQPEFLGISPNNKTPAIVDPEGPDGEPISVFESYAPGTIPYAVERYTTEAGGWDA
jgi:GST-like protein